MEDANGVLSVLEGFVPTIGRKTKQMKTMKDE